MGIYTNPILPGMHPDPSITRAGSTFFLVTSSFDFFPGIPVYTCTDLISWTLTSHVLTRRSQLDIRAVEPGGGVWAPTIRYRSAQQEGRKLGEGGVFYVCGATFDKYRPQNDERVWPRGWVTRCDEKDIWDEHGKGWCKLVYFDMIGYDQDLFWDDDGTVYLSSTYRKLDRIPVAINAKPLKDFAIHIARVDLTTGRCLSRPQVIRSSLAGSGVAEGSHIIKHGAYYYLFTAEGGTEAGHSEYVCRSKHGPLGPWEQGSKLVGGGTGPEDEVQNIGHCDLVEDTNGAWWAVLLAVRPTKGQNGTWKASVFGRETFLIPVTWENDWPIFNHKQPITLQSSGPGLYNLTKPKYWRDDFAATNLQLGWYRKSTPLTENDYTLTERPGYLRLYGSPYPLNTPACATMVLRKQTLRHVTFETEFNFTPRSSRTEAGIVVWWSYECFTSFGISLAKGSGDEESLSRQRVLRLRTPDGQINESHLDDADSTVLLSVNCGDAYEFGYCMLNGNNGKEDSTSSRNVVGSVSNEDMTRDPSIGLAFTGMMIGLYAFGDREASLEPADFAYASFERVLPE